MQVLQKLQQLQNFQSSLATEPLVVSRTCIRIHSEKQDAHISVQQDYIIEIALLIGHQKMYRTLKSSDKNQYYEKRSFFALKVKDYSIFTEGMLN